MPKADEILTGTVAEMNQVSMTADCDGHRFHILASEISWDGLVDPREMFEVGDKVNFRVTRILDQSSRSCTGNGSVRLANVQPNRWRGPTDQELSRVAEVQQALQRADYKLDDRELLAKIRTIPEDFLYHALFALATGPDHSTTAAKLLLELNPNCPISCEDAVRNIAMSQWDVSREEVPWYLVGQFGAQRVVKAFRQVQREEFTPDQRQTLKAIPYWVECAGKDSKT